ncbi:ATP-binding cassette domain-containing protein [Streptomyces silvensis]|uniref:ATP-binding cassette domain-containing protein n=1 Tax=Streptomyces silvensis TaxID=1765722 RepID=UPI00099E9E98|nr:ATP-binding cassette domain-containing protein [Streptomyces silvensis]
MTATTVGTAPPQGIAAKGLRKAYGEKVVLDGIDLDVAPGTIFALLGPNGAGKTTTVQILSTLIAADGGSALVAGRSLEREADAVRSAIGVTGQFAAVDDLLTAEENMLLVADLLHLDRAEGRRRAAELLARFDLADVAKKTASAFSGGMRRKLDLAMTLVGEPDVIFLDEPTTGLDPRSRRTMWELIRDLVAGGTTIFLTTQYLEEADQLADRIAVLDGGRIVAEGTADELKRLIPGGHIRLRFDDIGQLEAAVDRLALSTVVRDDETLSLQVPSDGSISALRAVLDVLEGAGVQAETLTVHTPDLDDVFLTLTGQGRTVHAPHAYSADAYSADAYSADALHPAAKEARR